MAKATFAAGCFWCVEAVLDRLDGVSDVESGYMGGAIDNPTYKMICRGDTGHAEVVQVKFDPAKVSYEKLLNYFFALHDPTTLNRQGNDVGTQYRSGIYCYSDAQRAAAQASCESYNKALADKGFDAITTEIIDAPEFYYAEPDHQQYLAKNPAGYCGLGGTGVACQVG